MFEKSGNIKIFSPVSWITNDAATCQPIMMFFLFFVVEDFPLCKHYLNYKLCPEILTHVLGDVDVSGDDRFFLLQRQKKKIEVQVVTSGVHPLSTLTLPSEGEKNEE